MKLTATFSYPNILQEMLSKDTLFNLAAGDDSLPLGQYSYAWQSGDRVRMLRDPLGLNKLFWSNIDHGHVIACNRIEVLIRAQVPLDKIRSVPPGFALSIGADGSIETAGLDITTTPVSEHFDINTFQCAVSNRLEEYFVFIRDRFENATFVVCLSGGLDSSVVAYLAAKHLPDVVCATFSYLPEGGFREWLSGCPVDQLSGTSDDFRTAIRVAAQLGARILPVFRAKASVIDHVRSAARLCQDWRDFNVHCAIVNLFLAEELRSTYGDRPLVVLTGDLMNEFVCDYREEHFNGEKYYRQPRISTTQKRRFFVRGLDAGDREIGVFNAFGITLIQPFASVAKYYLGVPGELLDQEDAKIQLNGSFLPVELHQMISGVKQRAQVGGVDGGTLGEFNRLQLQQDDLYKAWLNCIPGELRGSNPHELIEFGRYRTSPKQDLR